MSSELFSLLIGEAFLVEEKRKSLIQTFRKNSKEEVALHRFRLSETPLEQILKDARTLPFMASTQIFVLQDADALKPGKADLMVGYFQNPSSFSLFIAEAGALEKSHPFWEIAQKYGFVFTFEDKEKRSAAGRMIREILKQEGKSIAPRAAAKLEQHMGEAPALLTSVLKQLVSYAGGAKEITEEMAELFEEKWQEVNVFRFSETVISGKLDAALPLLRDLLDENEGDVVSIIGILHWQIRRHWLGRSLMEAGEPEAVILKKCKVSPKQASYFMKDLRMLSTEKLEQLLEGLFYLDWKVKTGELEGEAAIEAWMAAPAAYITSA